MSRTTRRQLPPAELKAMRGWAQLSPKDQAALRAEHREILKALHAEGQSRLAIGKHLFATSEILSPRRLFALYLRRFFHMSKSTAFNYINLWKAANRDAPKKVLDIAMSRNYKIVNRPEIFKTYPPPKTEDTAKIVEYLDKMEARKPKVITIHKNPNNLLKQALHSVEVCWNLLPDDPKVRTNWYKSLISMELTKFGVDREMRFMPEEIPASMSVVRGRPREKRVA